MDTRSKFNAEKYEQQDEWKFAFRPESNHYQRIGLDSERQFSTQEIDEAYQARVNWWKARKKQRDKGEESNPLIKKVGPYIDDALKYLGQASACLLDAEKKRAYDRSLEKSRTGEKEATLLGFITFTLRDTLLTTTEKRDLLEQARELGITRQRAEQLIWEEMAKCGAREVSDKEVISQASNQGSARPEAKTDPPQLSVSRQGSFSLGTLRKGEKRICIFSTDNKGGGILQGNIEVSDPEWLKVSDTEITGQKHHQDIRVFVDTASLALGSTYVGMIHIHSNGGKSEVQVDLTVELEKDAVSRFGKGLSWIGFLLGGLFGYALYTMIPNAMTDMDVALIAGGVATIMTIVVGAKMGKWGGGIGGFFLAAIAAETLKGASMVAYSTGAWATIYAGILYLSSRPLLIGKHAKKSGALVGVSLGSVGLTAAIVVGGIYAANLPPPPIQAGTVATCASVRGWHNFTAKTEFKLSEPVCVYAEALNVNRNNHIDVNYTFTLLGPDRTVYASRSVQCLLPNTTATACEQNVPDLRLPATAPSGSYALQVEMRNNLTGQTGQGTSTFLVTSTAKASMQREPARLLEAMSSQQPFLGEAGENAQRWPATLTFANVDTSSGQFTGQIEWTSLNAATKVEGVVSGTSLSFTETEYVRRGDVLLGVSYNLNLVDGNRLEGSWSYQNRSGAAWFTLPVSMFSDSAEQQLRSTAENSGDVARRSKPSVDDLSVPQTATTEPPKEERSKVPSTPIASPQAAFQTFQNAILQIKYPNDWRATGRGNSVTIAPDNGLVRDDRGNPAIAHGALIDIFMYTDDSTNATSLEVATDQLLQNIQRNNTQMRPLGPYVRIQLAGHEALYRRLINPLPLGGNDQIWLITVFRRGGLLHFLFVASTAEYEKSIPIFQAMRDSVQLLE